MLTNIMRFSNAQSSLYGIYLHVTIYKTYLGNYNLFQNQKSTTSPTFVFSVCTYQKKLGL
jgi:hypothetical protein